MSKKKYREHDSDAPWNQRNDYGESPGDICCCRSAGTKCYEHDYRNYPDQIITDADVIADLRAELAEVEKQRDEARGDCERLREAVLFWLEERTQMRFDNGHHAARFLVHYKTMHPAQASKKDWEYCRRDQADQNRIRSTKMLPIAYAKSEDDFNPWSEWVDGTGAVFFGNVQHQYRRWLPAPATEQADLVGHIDADLDGVDPHVMGIGEVTTERSANV